MTLLDTITPAPTARSFTPRSIRHELLLTAMTPVSHHDASVQDDSNRNLFNRQAVLAQVIDESATNITLEQAQIIAIDNPVPAAMAPLLEDFTLPEFLATLVVRNFADEFNSMDGVGLFSGMERWPNLGNRIGHAANASSMRQFYSRLTNIMQVGIPKSAGDEKLLKILTVPRGTQLDVLNVLRTQGHDIVRTARFWHDAQKQMSDKYADKVKAQGLDLAASDEDRQWVILAFDESKLVSSAGRQRRLEVPHITANSARHQMLREPAMFHLFEMLGIEPETLLPGVEALLYNGGNIAAGATQPSNPALLARQIRSAFPSLDLLGGVANAFDLGESAVAVSTILVSRETAHLLPDWARELPATQVSAFDLIEDFTLTRMAGKTGEGQMIFGFEGLLAGAQFIVTFDLKAYSTELARGAMMAALDTWAKAPVLGGASARGYGKMRIDDWKRDNAEADMQAKAAYETYLRDHAEGLKEQLVSGKLGTNTVLVS